MEQPYVRQQGALNELLIEVGVDIPFLTARSTQSQGQPPADRSAIMGAFVWWCSGFHVYVGLLNKKI